MARQFAYTQRGFTIVELLVIIVTLGILALISVVSYGSWQRTISTKSVASDTQQGTSSLESYKNFKNDYPPNLADTNFASSDKVVLIMSTNAPQVRVYNGLSSDQNAQLLLNTCNANMPTTSADGSTTYNTTCSFAGNNFHVKGTQASNVLLNGPTITKANFALTCGSTCDATTADIISEFESQGGTFPISVPKSQVALPAPTLTTYGSATAYCLEGRSIDFSDIIYHTTNKQTSPVQGPCPADATLHYP